MNRLTKTDLSKPLSTGQRGDTIIEVMIAVVIVALVFGAAFSLANRSTKNSIGSRERVEALKLVEGQIETLKTKRGDPSFATTYQTSGYCFDASGVKTTSVLACKVRTLYQMSINYTSTPPTGLPYFTVKATWDSLTGTTNVASIDYRP